MFSHFQGSRAFEDLAPSEQDKPYLYSSGGALGWWTLNLRSSYNINQYLSLDGGIENILNYHYRSYSSGISAAGTNLYITMRGFIPQ